MFLLMLEILQFIGLGFVVAGWSFQLSFVLKGDNDLHQYFLLSYITGLVLLIIGSKNRGLDFISILNIISVVLATLIFIKIRK